jgi:gliding motility-associated-like protein/uncharacterized repeat protein (TIGR01451 family)
MRSHISGKYLIKLNTFCQTDLVSRFLIYNRLKIKIKPLINRLMLIFIFFSILPSLAGNANNIFIGSNAQAASVTILKEADKASVSQAGEIITYTYMVTNNGDETLTNVSVTDDKLGSIVLDKNTLDPLQTATGTFNYTVTQNDIDTGGSIDNEATVNTDEAATANDDVSVTIIQSPSVSIAKAADKSSVSSVGELITYTITVDNSGNVSLTNVVLTDDFAGGATLASGDDVNPGVLDVGETWIYSADFEVTQDDIDAGDDLVNVASVDTDQTDAQQDDAITTITQNKSVIIEKSVDKASVSAADEIITYTYKVTNDGNTTLTGITVSDDKLGSVTLGATTLSPGNFTEGTKTYTVTQSDINSGSDIENVATVTTSEGPTDNDNASVSISQAASVIIEKSADKASVTAADEIITYTYKVTNDGNTSLTGISVSDDKLGSVTLGATTLSPGNFTEGTKTYTVTQSDINSGSDIENVATVATSEGPTDNDNASVSISQAASVIIEKTADKASVSAADEIITYTYKVTNDGNTSLTGISVSDDKLGSVTLGATTLSPGNFTEGTKTYTVTQSDINSGNDIVNVATVTTSQGVTDDDNASVGIIQNESVLIEKTADKPSVSQAGEIITYTYKVTNNGNTTLTGIAVSDDKLGAVTLGSASLLPGTNTEGTKTYTVSQGDINSGSDIVNVATVTTTEGPTDNDNATVGIAQDASVLIEKTADKSSVSQSGEMITYTYKVTNNGNTNLTGITVSDDKLGAVVLGSNSLSPGNNTQGTKTYTVSQSDINSGSDIVNVATVTTTEGPTDTDNATVGIAQNASVLIEKTADKASVSQSGEIITYTYKVTNNGNTTLTGIAVSDDKIGAVVLGSNSLSPGNNTQGTKTYTVSQSDINSGSNIVNVATVTTTEGPTDNDNATVAVAQDASVLIEKTADKSSVSAAGETITYTYKVTNNGNTTLTGITVSDDKLGAVSLESTTLSPGDFTEGTAIYEVTQSDINLGLDIVNEVTVSTDQNVTDNGIATVSIVQIGSVSLEKTANKNNVAQTGEEVIYSYEVINTGNILLTGISVTDDKLGAVTLGTTILLPEESTQGTASYTVSQDDINSGSDIVNEATVTTTEGPTDSDIVAVSVSQNISVLIEKTADRSSVSQAGVIITYTYRITNSGNTTLTGLAVTDDKLGVVLLETTILSPGDFTEGTKSYLVTQEDINSGSDIVNEATVTASEGPTDNDFATVTISQEESVFIEKTADKSSVSTAGEIITYTYKVTNDGNTTLTGITVSDDKLGAVSLESTTLSPGGFTDGTKSYMVTQEDINSGDNIVNVATVTTTEGPSDNDNARVSIIRNASISIVKTADKTNVSSAGDTITYTYRVTNDGNTTLTGITVLDDKLGAVSLEATTLLPGDFTEGTKIYVVTQEDINSGSEIVNVATVNTLEGTSDEDSTTVNIGQSPSVTISKTADKSNVSFAGEVITYFYKVTNMGNIFLTGVTVTDDKLGSITLGTRILFLGASTEGTATYTVTQDDINAGDNIVNVATVTTSQGPTASDNATVSIGRIPSVLIEITADKGSVSLAGEVITYFFKVTNTGNTTLTGISVSDDKQGSIVLDNTSLSPGEIAGGTGTYTVTQSDMNAGNQIVNTVTVTTSEGATDTDSETVNINQSSSVTIEKTADKSGVSTAGELITYTYMVTNTGNILLTGVKVTDDKLGEITLDSGILLPGASVEGVATYNVTQADINAGNDIVNVATVTTMQGPTASDDEIVKIDRNPGLNVIKTASPVTYSSAGNLIYFTIVVENTGNIMITDIVVSDPMTGLSANLNSLSPGGKQTFTQNYTITQADMDEGRVSNTANASGRGADNTVIENSDTRIIYAEQNPSIFIEKEAALLTGDVFVNEVVDFYIRVSNTGNVTLSDVLVEDPLTGFEQVTTRLLPGESLNFTTSYTVQASDETKGNFDNEAIVTARAPDGSEVEAASTVTVQVEHCEMVIPTGFSPNDDNIQDYWRIYCLEKYPDARVEIYNRWGNRVFEKDNFGNTDVHGEPDAWWDGYSTQKRTFGNDKLPTGTYYYILDLKDGSDPLTGFIYLNR